MALDFMAGYQLGEQLARALGIEGDVMRIVIDCPADGIVTVYVQRPLYQSEVMPLCEALAEARKTDPPLIVEATGIEVDERGRVTATRKP